MLKLGSSVIQRKLQNQDLCLISVPVHLPAEITDSSLVHGTCRGGEVRGYVMLEAVLANVMQQILQVRNLDDTDAAKRVQRIRCEFTLSNVAAHHTGCVIG